MISIRRRLRQLAAVAGATTGMAGQCLLAQPAVWSPQGINGGGALFAPSYNPHNSNEFYIACDVAGLFRTTTGGTSWELTDFRQLVGNRGTQVQFTEDPLVRYALHYDNVSSAQAPYRSLDGGATWTAMSPDPTGFGAYAFYADPADQDRLLLTDYDTLYVSTDGGASWNARYTAAGGNGLYAAGAFFDGVNIYVGTNEGLLVSSNSGSTFAVSSVTGIASGEAMISFTGAKEGSTTRFFCATWASADVYPGVLTEGEFSASFQGLYKLDVGEAAWSAAETGLPGTAYPLLVSMARNEIDIAYVAGGSSSSSPTVYKWTSGGGTWSSVFQTVNNANIQTGFAGHQGDMAWSFGEVAMGFAVDPTSSSRALITDFGFAHHTTDGGATWSALYVDPDDLNPAGSATPTGQFYAGIGLEPTACWDLCWATTDTIIASYTDIHVVRSTDGGDSWNEFYGSPTMNTFYRVVKHPTTGVLYAATSTVHDMYQSTYLSDARIDGGDGQVLYSTNNGATWQLLHDFNDVVVWVELDPTNSDRLYASVAHSSTGGVYYTNNLSSGASSTWAKTAANPPRTQGHPYNIRVLDDGALAVSYSGRRTGTGFQTSSGVFYSTDQGANWSDRSAANMQYWTKDLVVDPHDGDQDTWYVGVFSGWGGTGNDLGGLYRTTDRGLNWTRVWGTNAAPHNVESVTISPAVAGEAYVTTENEGLFHTTNLGASPTMTELTSYPFAHPMRVFHNPSDVNQVWITSFGNGLRMGSTTPTPVTLSGWGVE